MQVVAVRGRNLAGESLRAQQLIAAVPRPLPTSSPDSLRIFGAATGAYSAMIGCAAVCLLRPVTLSSGSLVVHYDGVYCCG